MLYCIFSNAIAESTPFITFMLSAIRSSIIEIISLSEEMIDEPSSKEYRRWLTVRTYLHEHDFIQNSTACKLLNIFPPHPRYGEPLASRLGRGRKIGAFPAWKNLCLSDNRQRKSKGANIIVPKQQPRTCYLP
ncbi:MAG: hypothetical protein LUE06_08765 [Oscillospiraceae bacterium]|nr:hypothetical protein [Oscillospiraceae bacterium]